MNEASSMCVSVIVPAYNARATLGASLEALCAQDCFQPYEVIVVDDGSADNTAEIVDTFNREKSLSLKKFQVRYVRQDNAGPASARNHGARLALGEYLAFTDSDCIPHQDWISKLMAGFNQPQVGVVAGSYGIANPHSWLARAVHAEIRWRHEHLLPDYPKAFGSYNFCVKREIFETVQGFNTDYRRASGEDNDLSYKILAHGWRIYFEREALVDHRHPSRVGKYLKEQFQHGFWRVKMYRDHPRMVRGDDYTFWKDIVELPLALTAIMGSVLSALGFMRFNDFACFVLFPFLVFEILAALIITQSFFEGILFGFVMMVRAFVRLLGFSTGIFRLLF